MQLIAIKEFTYAKVPLKPGDPFRASAEDARILKGIGKAIDRPLQSAAMQAKQSQADDDNSDAGADKRAGKRKSNRYDRRDMRAQE
jgi:hypothetical protein